MLFFNDDVSLVIHVVRKSNVFILYLPSTSLVTLLVYPVEVAISS